MSEYTLDDIRGRNVIDTRGTTLGEVEDVLFDSNNWQVSGFLVNLRREVADDLHLDKPAFGNARLTISKERVQAMGENVILNVNTDDIATILRTGHAPNSQATAQQQQQPVGTAGAPGSQDARGTTGGGTGHVGGGTTGPTTERDYGRRL